MSANELDADHPPAQSAGPAHEASVPVGAPDRRGGPPAIRTIALVAGVLAGSIAWAIGEGLRHTFRPPLEQTEMMGHVIWKARYPDQAAADFKNATIAFTLLGMVLGASLGYAGGRARRSSRAGLKAGLTGLLLGGVLAVTSSLALLSVYFGAEARSKEDLSRDLVLPLIVLGGISGAAGLGGGLGLGSGLGCGPAGSIRAGLGGAIGGALGAAAYLLIGATIFTGGNIAAPLAASWSHRLIARLFVGALTGWVAATFAVLAPRKAPAVPG